VTLRIFTEPQQGASYDQLLAVARETEALGFAAFFRSDHYLKMGSASGLPATTDAWVTLAGLARDTSTIRLGTLVSPVTFRSVGTFAVTVAEVDQMSGGRIDIGVGAGWYEAEHVAYGLPFPSASERYDLLEDQLAILHGLWSSVSGAVFEYRGVTTTVSIAADTVRPYRRPPIVLGGNGGPRSARLAAQYADEYNKPFADIESIRAAHDRVRRACEAVDRDPSSVVYSAALVLCCGSSEAEVVRRAAAIGRDAERLRASGLAGTPAEVLDKLGTLAEASVDRVDRFYLQVLDLSDLDHLRLVAEEVMPHAPGR
jgi:F420-dependent oxidoreductase-like protein